jgi:hypothetical protein
MRYVRRPARQGTGLHRHGPRDRDTREGRHTYVSGEDSYRYALERARQVSPDHIPCSWCGKPTLGPDHGVVLCATCHRI